LRVSEEVLDPELPGQLYVYKGVMNAAVIAERLETLPASTSVAAGESCASRGRR
jgi:hypothetical protein